MEKHTIKLSLFLALLIFSLGTNGCVGKKKFYGEISTRDSINQQLNQRILSLNKDIANLNLSLSEKSGAVEALKELNGKQDSKIRKLEGDIEHLTKQSLSQQQTMDGTLKLKEAQIAAKEKVIQNIQAAIEKQKQSMQNLLITIRDSLVIFNGEVLTLEVQEDRAVVGLSEKLLFKPGTTSLSKDALAALGKIAAIVGDRPELNLNVESHTDNSPTKSKEFKDNWDLTAAQAAVIARTLTKEFYLNASQIIPCGRGEFLPRSSNETPEGRASNRRTEFIFSTKSDDIQKLIQASDMEK
jgi:chemotaxis protein MotB